MNDFSLYRRASEKGKVYYFCFFDSNKGKYIRKTTRQTEKRKAIKFAKEYLNTNASNYSEQKTEEKLTFEKFSEGWFDWDICPYVLARRTRGTSKHPCIKKSYVDKSKEQLQKHIIPYFRKYKLEKIEPKDCEAFFREKKKTLSNRTINSLRTILSIMFGEAEKNHLIKENPIRLTQKLLEDEYKREILTNEEINKVFYNDAEKKLWKGSYKYFAIAFLSLKTGMRLGELLALRFSDIKYNYLEVSHSYSKRYGLSTTKNSETRIIPITDEVKTKLNKLKEITISSDFVFQNALNSGTIHEDKIRRYFYDAMNKIGISEEERVRRGLTFHSLRSSFITNAQIRGIPKEIIAAVVGHKTITMVDHYTNFSKNDLIEAFSKTL